MSASPASKDSGLTKSSRAPATIRSSLRFFFCERLCVTIARTIREGAVASCSPAFCSTAEGGCRRVGRSPYDARFVATHHTHDRFDSLFGLAILRRPFQVHRILRPGRNSLLPSLRVARLRTSTALMGFSPFAGLLPPVGGTPHRSFTRHTLQGRTPERIASQCDSRVSTRPGLHVVWFGRHADRFHPRAASSCKRVCQSRRP